LASNCKSWPGIRMGSAFTASLAGTKSCCRWSGTPASAGLRSCGKSGTSPMVTAEPLVVITPSHRWVALDLPGLWSYRELLYFLTWRDVKIRYKQTALGIGWALLQPLLTLLVFTILFGKMAKIPSGGQPYTTFVLAGILPWTFFANAVTASSNSL